MPDNALQPCVYHIVRYQPNLVRDEWINIGVLLLDPSTGHVRQRWLDEPADFSRLRRLHPAADEDLLLRLPAEFDRLFAGAEAGAGALLEKFDQTLSNAVQLSPRKGLLAADFGAELERLYREQVEPQREPRRAPGAIRTRSELRAQAADYFRSEKILARMERGMRVAEFTYPGDPMRIDFAYRRNGTRGFVQAVPLGRDPGQAKLLAYTAGAIRGRTEHAEFLAVTEREAARENPRDQFVTAVLEDNGIRVVPLAGLRKWAHDIAPALRANGNI
jgi:Protein of unknown function (DUF3037)